MSLSTRRASSMSESFTVITLRDYKPSAGGNASACRAGRSALTCGIFAVNEYYGGGMPEMFGVGAIFLLFLGIALLTIALKTVKIVPQSSVLLIERLGRF